MVFGRTKGEKDMSTDEAVDVPDEEAVEETTKMAAVDESPKEPKHKEPETNIEVGATSAVVEVPLDCGDKPQADVLINQMATAKALAISKARTIIKAVKNSKTTAKESRPVMDMAAKNLVVEVAFEPAIDENFVKAAQEAV